MATLKILIWLLSASFLFSPAFAFDVIAHRGVHSGTSEENTICSILKAVNSPSPQVEFDVIRTKDDQLILNHDYEVTPQKFSNLNHKSDLREMTLVEIQKLRHKKDNSPIPTLEDLFRALQGNTTAQGMTLHLEVKSDTGSDEFKREFAALIIDMIDKYQMGRHIIVRSFDWDIVEHFKKISPEIRRALLVGGIKRASFWNYKRRSAHSIYNQYEPVLIAPSRSLMSARMVHTWKAYGVSINPYTVNSIEEARTFLEMGASGITTDIPKEMYRTFFP